MNCHSAIIVSNCITVFIYLATVIEIETCRTRNVFLQVHHGISTKLPISQKSAIYSVYYQLYTRSLPTSGLLMKGNEGLQPGWIENFGTEKPTIVIIHGWRSSCETEWVPKMRRAYLEVSDVNVVVVDWSALALNETYAQSCRSTVAVGSAVARLLDGLVEAGCIRIRDIHLVGHSLGAQVAGVVGAAMRAGRPARITGLDSARPGGFERMVRPEHRLDSSDADFVDCIHTSAGLAGCAIPLGHADFYPNGGVVPQPGCVSSRIVCSHTRVNALFLESILSKGFVARKCAWNYSSRLGLAACNSSEHAIMGHHISLSTRGTFYLETYGAAPFAKG